MRALLWILLCFTLSLPAVAQETADTDRSATGGATTLEDIMARQRGETIDDSFRRDATGDPNSAAGIASQLGTLGGTSDSEVWRALRYGSADVTVSSGGEVASVLMQDGGMKWFQFRDGPLSFWGGWSLIGTIGVLLAFYMIRGRVPLDYEKTGETVTRFKAFERFSHWLLAMSFLLLGITGLLSLFGRTVVAPLLGKEANASILIASKWVHNNVAWPFMIALVFVFFLWVWHNIPSRTDLTWIRKGGGIIGSAHPPAKKFNFGQKLVFWSVIVLGSSIAASGLSLLFPYELPMFAKTFTILNDIGITGALGLAPLPELMSPQEEMQYAQAWHAIVAFALMCIIVAHIYIGTVGMEGAYDAMGSGEVDEAWARQHHSIWLEEVQGEEKAAPKDATPAE